MCFVFVLNYIQIIVFINKNIVLEQVNVFQRQTSTGIYLKCSQPPISIKIIVKQCSQSAFISINNWPREKLPLLVFIYLDRSSR